MTRVKIAKWNKFYKYGTFSRIERVRNMLCGGEFYFAPPSELNDPSDCRNLIKNHTAKEIEEFLVRTHRELNGDNSDDDYIRSGIKKFGSDKILEEMTNQFNKIMDSKYGVFSLTQRSDNMALWAKYAADHTGYCLEFNDLSSFSSVYEVIYSKKFPISLGRDDLSQVEYLFTKAPEWSNEEEARIIDRPPGIRVFPRGSLKAIILGERCQVKNEKAVLEWAETLNLNVDIKKAAFSRGRQKLEFRIVYSTGTST